jgi:putative methionine-R-sulfoxide reductase with GAF domain
MHVSLYRSIQGQYGWMRDVKSVPMMNTISHLIEDQVARHKMAVDLYAGFQQFSFFMRQEERYRQLAEVARRVYVFGLPDSTPPVITGIEFVPLPAESALRHEWFLLVDTPDFWTTLTTREVEGHDAITGGRKFDGIWTFDVDLVNRIALLVSQVLGRVYLPIVQRNYARQYEHISEINNRLMARLETSRLHERQRWRQMMAIQHTYEVLSRHQPLAHSNEYPLELLRDTIGVLQGMFTLADTSIAYSLNGRNEYYQITLEGATPTTKVVVHPGQGPSGRALAERRFIYVPDARHAPQADPLVPRAATVLSAPILSRRNRMHGVLTVGGSEPGLWSEEDGKTVQVIAMMLGSVLDQEASQDNDMHALYERNRSLEQAIVRMRTPVSKLLDLQQQLWAAGALNVEQSELLTAIGQLLTHMNQALGAKAKK